MPWREQSIMELREEFARLASVEGANMRELCRRYQISPTTGDKWLDRFRREGRPGLADAWNVARDFESRATSRVRNDSTPGSTIP
jgi:transposase-like protein